MLCSVGERPKCRILRGFVSEVYAPIFELVQQPRQLRKPVVEEGAISSNLECGDAEEIEAVVKSAKLILVRVGQ